MKAALRRASALALAASLVFAPAAWAGSHYKVLGNDAAWEVGTGTDSQGNDYCSIQNQSKDQSYGLLLLIYPLGDDPSFELHAFKNNWSIPANADVPTTFNFSDGGSWDADGQAAGDGSSVVDYTIDVQDMKDFLADFSSSNRLDIVFTKGTAPAWTEDLTGTSQATQDLLSCAKKLLDANGGSGGTQPFSPPDNSTPPPDNAQPYALPPDSSSPAPGGNTQSL